MTRDNSRSVLIIHPGGLGDVLLSLPAIAALRRQYPQHSIGLLAASAVGKLLRLCGVVDRIFTTESGDLASCLGGVEQVSGPLRRLMESCDCVVAWFNDRDGSLQATCQALGVRRIVIEKPVSPMGAHQSAGFLHALGEQAGDLASEACLTIPEDLARSGAEALRASGMRADRSAVLCHPGSGSAHKCMQPGTMAAVIRMLRERGLSPALIGGPADDQAVEQVVQCGLRDIPVIQGLPLTTVAGILVHTKLFVGHDSGLTHLSAAILVPTVAVFGPTDPHQWAPRGPHVVVVTGPPCTCHGWERVRACETKPCLSIRPEIVVAASMSLLDRYPTVTKS